MLGAPALTRATLLRGATIALALVVFGLASSAFHLGNPRNAWKSLARLRTSWLSREAASSMVLLGIASLWLVATARDLASVVRLPLAIAVVVLSCLTLYFTAMIYASLKPIRQWNTPRVPMSYAALGHASGALLVVALLRAHDESSFGFAIVAGALLAAAAVVKLDYYAYIAGDIRRMTIEQAIGVAQGVGPPGAHASRMQARLLDVGHSRGTFLTHEFGYTLRAGQRTSLRLLVWIAGFVVPALWLLAGLDDAEAAALAMGTCLLGIGAERWLFFAEARHTVRLYHGDRST